MEKGQHHSEETKQKLRLKRLGSKRSEETKKKIVEGLKGRKVSNETREKLRLSNVGKKRTIEQRKNMSVARKKAISEGRVKPNPYWKGKKLSEKHRKNISFGGMGKVMSKEAKEKISLAQKGKPRPYAIGNKSRTGQHQSEEEKMKRSLALKGEKSFRWKGGYSEEERNIRENYKIVKLRLKVLERDKFICQECGKRENKLISHHIISIKECIKLNREDLAFDINNCITLCDKCHSKIEYERIKLMRCNNANKY